MRIGWPAEALRDRRLAVRNSRSGKRLHLDATTHVRVEAARSSSAATAHLRRCIEPRKLALEAQLILSVHRPAFHAIAYVVNQRRAKEVARRQVLRLTRSVYLGSKQQSVQ